MKELYTIGEVTKLIGISSQTLRYSDKIGVVRACLCGRKEPVTGVIPTDQI